MRPPLACAATLLLGCHSGAVTTMHANGARDTIPRFAGMVLEAGEGIPLDEIYAMIGSNVHLIVYLGRHPATGLPHRHGGAEAG